LTVRPRFADLSLDRGACFGTAFCLPRLACPPLGPTHSVAVRHFYAVFEMTLFLTPWFRPRGLLGSVSVFGLVGGAGSAFPAHGVFLTNRTSRISGPWSGYFALEPFFWGVRLPSRPNRLPCSVGFAVRLLSSPLLRLLHNPEPVGPIP